MAGNAQQAGAIDESARPDILAALGAQTNVALNMRHDKPGAEIEMNADGGARVMCSQAPGAARELVGWPRPRPWATCGFRPVSVSGAAAMIAATCEHP